MIALIAHHLLPIHSAPSLWPLCSWSIPCLLQPQGLHSCCSSCLELSSLYITDNHAAHSLSSPGFLFKCHLLGPPYFFFFLKIFFFLMWTIFKVFIELVTILLLFYALGFFSLQGLWDLISPTRDQTCAPYIGRQSLNHWTTREIPGPPYFDIAPCHPSSYGWLLITLIAPCHHILYEYISCLPHYK